MIKRWGWKEKKVQTTRSRWKEKCTIRKLLGAKGGHRCAEQKACIGFSSFHTHPHTHTDTLLPLRFNTGAEASPWSIRLPLSWQHSRVVRDREKERWMGSNLERGVGREKVFPWQWWRRKENDKELGWWWLWWRKLRKQGVQARSR